MEAQLPTEILASFKSLISANCSLKAILMMLRNCTRPRPRRPVAADACLVDAVLHCPDTPENCALAAGQVPKVLVVAKLNCRPHV